MRVLAQMPIEEDYFNHKYTIYVPNNEARKWATYILKRLRIPKQYVSRRQGFLSTGEPSYMARYIGMINNDQLSAIQVYLPYAPAGAVFECPGCGA